MSGNSKIESCGDPDLVKRDNSPILCIPTNLVHEFLLLIFIFALHVHFLFIELSNAFAHEIYT